MTQFSSDALRQAHRSLLSTLRKCGKINMPNLGKSPQTLLTQRIAALRVALDLIRKEQMLMEIGEEQP